MTKSGDKPRLSAELITLLAHDLKNPLAAVLANLHFLQVTGAGKDDDEREALEDSIALCTVLDRYISNLDYLGRECGDPPPTGVSQAITLNGLVQESIRRMEPQAQTSDVRIVWSEPEEAVWTEADPELLGRAVDNLVSNAVEHAPAGSEVNIEVAAGYPDATIVIRDGGPAAGATQQKLAGQLDTHAQIKGDPKGRYGRAGGLLVAMLAAGRAGARVMLEGTEGAAELRLVVPALKA